MKLRLVLSSHVNDIRLDLLWGLELHLRKHLPKFLHFLSMGRSGETNEKFVELFGLLYLAFEAFLYLLQILK